MTQLLSKFFAKKPVSQVNEPEVQAQAALQHRVNLMLRHHEAVAGYSASN